MNYWSKINFSNATRNIHLKNNLKARSSSTYKVLFDFFYKTSKLNTNINLSVFYIFNAKKITILSKLKIFLQQSQLDFRTNVPKHDIIIKTKLELSGKKKDTFIGQRYLVVLTKGYISLMALSLVRALT